MVQSSWKYSRRWPAVLSLTLSLAWLGCESDAPTGTVGTLAHASDVVTSFQDVPGQHWAYRQIEVLFQEGYVAGCSTSPRKYCPDEALSRAEVAVFVMRGINGAGYVPEPPTVHYFDDVPPTSWAAKWVNELFEEGYTDGCGVDRHTGDPLYCPWRDVSRAEACVFFSRMLEYPGYTPPDPKGIFANLSRDYWGTEWIEAAYGAGLLPDHMIKEYWPDDLWFAGPQLRFQGPDDPLTRAEAAYMMYNAKPLPDFDPETGPTNLAIRDWNHWARWCADHPDPDNCDSRVERARQVKHWLLRFEGNRWWEGVFPPERQLAAWLLHEEGGTLCYAEDQRRMVRAFRSKLGGGMIPDSLAHYTAFYDPHDPGTGDFDDTDWAELVVPMEDGQVIDIASYLGMVNQVYSEQFRADLVYPFWWDSTEMVPRYAGKHTMFNPDPLKTLTAKVVNDQLRACPPAGPGVPFYFSQDACVFLCALGRGGYCACP